jgi:gamma-glutamyltranspeptidase/glutathione hydrolase
LTRGVVVSPHHLATDAGVEILREGGNAVDAAIAASAVLTVVYPNQTGIGGDLFALVWQSGRDAPVGLQAAGRSGRIASIDAVRERGLDAMPERGALTATVPGAVAGWGRLLETFGTVGFGAVLEAAAAIARDGYVVTPTVADALREADWMRREEFEARRLFPPLQAGMTLRNPELSASLMQIARAGFNIFYRGELAAALADAVQRRDGFLTTADFFQHRCRWLEPLTVAYRGMTVYELPPPTQGLAAIGFFRALAAMPSGQLHPGAHLARTLRRLRDRIHPLRDALITDPDFADVPVEPFYALDATVASPSEMSPHGDTVYLCAADEHGNLVSLIQSVAWSFGSGVIAEGTGVLLQNRGAYFNLDRSHVNRLEPGKLTMHTLIPALALAPGGRRIAFGTMGADGQPLIQAQLLANLVDGAMPPGEAVARVRTGRGGGELCVEADYPDAAELQRSEPGVRLLPSRHSFFGHAAVLAVDAPRQWHAGADPRSEGSVGEA